MNSIPIGKVPATCHVSIHVFQKIKAIFSVSAKSCHETPFYPLTLTQQSLPEKSYKHWKQIPTLNKFNDIHSFHRSVPQKYARSCPTYFTHSLILFQIIHSSLAIDSATLHQFPLPVLLLLCSCFSNLPRLVAVVYFLLNRSSPANVLDQWLSFVTINQADGIQNTLPNFLWCRTQELNLTGAA